MRAVGEITQEIENTLYEVFDGKREVFAINYLLKELSIEHDLQHGEVLSLLFSWLKIHVKGRRFRELVLQSAYEWLKLNVPEQAEEYFAGGKPNLPKIFGFKE